MREGWEYKSIGDVCTVIAGQSPKSMFYNQDGDGLPFYQGKKLFGKKFIYPPNTWTTKITKEALKDDILMSVRAPVGPINFATEKICIGRGLAAIRAEEKINKEYLFYFLTHNENEITGNTGAVFNSINKKQIEELNILIPATLSEQTQIVNTLDKTFKQIDQAKVNLEKNIHNAKELFQSKLNEVFSQRGEGWEEKTLKEVCKKITDGAHHSPKKLYTEKTKGLYPYITSKNIRNNYMDFTKVQYVDSTFHDSTYARCTPRLGDVLLTKDGANTGNITINTLDEPFSLLSSVCLMSTKKEELLPEYLKYYIQSPNGFRSIVGKMTGAAIKRIILRDIKSAKIPITTIKSQEKIVLDLNLLYTQTKSIALKYQHKLNNLEELKKSILQKAFSGELDYDEL